MHTVLLAAGGRFLGMNFYPTEKYFLNLIINFFFKFNFNLNLEQFFSRETKFNDPAIAVSISNKEIAIFQLCNGGRLAE
jgi:hypothetical protein